MRRLRTCILPSLGVVSLVMAAILPHDFASSVEIATTAISDGADALTMDFASTPIEESQETESQAMHALEAVTFASNDIVYSASQRYSPWLLDLCVGICDSNHTSKPYLLTGQSSLSGVKVNEATFNLCNKGYVECQTDCLKYHNGRMNSCPKIDAKPKYVMTSNLLPNCMQACISDSENDFRTVQSMSPYPSDDARFNATATVTLCNRPLGICSHECRNEFSREVSKWDKEHGM